MTDSPAPRLDRHGTCVAARRFLSKAHFPFTGTQKDGGRVEVTGCDLFTFRDGKIAIKNSYRKNRPAI